jgi:hypothetical protein
MGHLYVVCYLSFVIHVRELAYVNSAGIKPSVFEVALHVYKRLYRWIYIIFGLRNINIYDLFNTLQAIIEFLIYL